ncbi:MAG: hypothetical protein IJM01_02445 [Eubacterium sp.]|nr:hypothetical protein [Eubacterium sp.]
MTSKVKLFYNPKENYIIYQRGNLIIGSILRSYDELVRIVDFDGGLLTVVMKRKNTEIEEYIDFSHALALLYMTKLKKQYFDGVSAKDISVERSIV